MVDHHDVAPGAKTSLAGAGQHDGPDLVVALPVGEHLGYRVDHRMGQRIDGLRTVEGDQADAVLDSY